MSVVGHVVSSVCILRAFLKYVWLVAWRSGNTFCQINDVALRRVRLVLGWVSVCGQVNHLGAKPASQVDSAFYPPWDGKMSIGSQAE